MQKNYNHKNYLRETVMETVWQIFKNLSNIFFYQYTYRVLHFLVTSITEYFLQFHKITSVVHIKERIKRNYCKKSQFQFHVQHIFDVKKTNC